MYFTDDSLLPENQDPLMITAAPYGPFFMPDDYPGQVPVTWKEQVQAAVDCYNAGASILHIHVRDPKTGYISKNFAEYNDQIGRLRQAVPKMVLQIGGSISLSPPPGATAAKWSGYDTRPHAHRNRSQAGSDHHDVLLHVGGPDVRGGPSRP